MASQAWGLPEKKKVASPPKCFNIASRFQKSGIEQPVTTRIHPLAVVKILDAFIRRPEGAKRIIGTLLGWISEGSIVDITDSFPVVHKDADEGVLLDQEYHKTMLALRQKISPREVVVGWFSTGDEINASSAVIHGFYCTKESQFTPTVVLPGPVHLLVDTNTPLNSQAFSIKAFVNVRTTIADNLLQFHEIPLAVQTSSAERAGITQLMQARRMYRDTANTKDMSDIDGFEGGLQELLGLFKRIQEYVRAVIANKATPDLQVGRGLTAALCAEQVIDLDAVDNLCKSSLQDALMVVYLSNLTRTQISIAEKINSQFADVFRE